MRSLRFLHSFTQASSTVFLAAMDLTIVAVALPTIVEDIGGATGYSWVGSAYFLSEQSKPI